MTEFDLYKKKFSFTFVEPSYGDTPCLKRETHIELSDECTYEEVVEEFLSFLSGCWGYEINMESLMKKYNKEKYAPEFSEVYRDEEEDIQL